MGESHPGPFVLHCIWTMLGSLTDHHGPSWTMVLLPQRNKLIYKIF